ncbi:hypothetical protein MTO96_023390 [Rhipicephalus appendiculatus]
MAPPQTPCRLSNAPPPSAGTVQATLEQSDGGTEQPDEASQSCSRQYSVSLHPMPTAAVTERHTSRTDVTKVEELVMSTSSESVVSRSCSRRSAFPLCFPEFATSSGHADTGEAKAAENFAVMTASEASGAEHEENDDISIVTDASSNVLPEALPNPVGSPEDSFSRSSGKTTLEECDMVPTEMTTVHFAQFTEPHEVPRDTCSESLLTTIEVGLDQEGVDIKALAAAEKSQDAKAHSNEHQSSGSFNLPEKPNLDYTQNDSEQGAEPNVEAGHEPQRSTEGTGVVVEATVRPVTAALDVEEGQVKQSLPCYAICPSEAESLSPKPEDHLQAPNTPETPVTAESVALGRSDVVVTAVDHPPVVDTSRAALPEEEAPVPATANSIFFIVSPLQQPPSQAAIGSDAEACA